MPLTVTRNESLGWKTISWASCKFDDLDVNFPSFWTYLQPTHKFVYLWCIFFVPPNLLGRMLGFMTASEPILQRKKLFDLFLRWTCIYFWWILLQMIYSFLFNKISKLSPFFWIRVVLSMLTGKSTATTSIAMRLRRNMSVTVKNSWTSLRYASYKKSSKDMTNFWRLTNFFLCWDSGWKIM